MGFSIRTTVLACSLLVAPTLPQHAPGIWRTPQEDARPVYVHPLYETEGGARCVLPRRKERR